ncbi:hypothetical protein SDC9_206632 [bioreactor metagenome]|uniref:Uncharacterized protein n=1 Tax=bioreactor metagenome TaxID=1076179 RepID=A0A645J633_9ZZZZ
MRHAVKRLGHPKRTFAARSALAAAFMRVKLGQVRQGSHDIGRIIHDDNRARSGHAACRNQRVKVIGQIEHIDLLLGILPVGAFPFQLKFFTSLEHFRG